MKIIATCLLLLCISNLSFSQSQIEKKLPEETTVFKFYPNPAKGDLYILGTLKIKNIELINAVGKRVAIYNFNKSFIKIDVSELKSGIYSIQAIDENNKSETKKLVIK